jgi:hypothetical protein
MSKKIGRNDPCPCGSNKKYKACCGKPQSSSLKRKFSAVWINDPAARKEQAPMPEPVNLMERTYGHAIGDHADLPETPPPEQ